MRKLYVVCIRWAKTEKDKDTLSPVFATIGDWLYFDNHCWLVWSEKDSHDIFQVLGAHLSNEDMELIFEVSPGMKSGWAPAWVWQWIDERQMRYGGGIGGGLINRGGPGIGYRGDGGIGQ